MKILITSGIFPPDIGGPASYVPKIANYLTQKGHEVTVVCLTDQMEHQDKDRYLFRVIRISRKHFLPLRMLITIYNILKASKGADIIYANTIAIESSISALLARKKIIHKVVGDYAWERARNKSWYKGTIDQYQSSKKGVKLLAMDWLRNFPLKLANRVIVPSNYLGNIVAGWGVKKDDIKVIYNAMDLKELKNNKKSSDKIQLSTICRLTPWKGVDQVINALKFLPNVEFSVIGGGPLNEQLKDLSKSLGLEDRITFYGHMKHEEALKLLLNSDLFILNSTYEGLPHVVIESMFYGVPVICNNVGGCPEIVIHNDTGYLMDINEIDQINKVVKAIKAYQENPTRFLQFAENAKEIIEDTFSFTKMINSTEDLLRKTV